MRSWLARRDGDPRGPLSRQGACLAAASVGGKLGGDAHNLKREEWCDALAGDALTLADRLIAEQDDRAWSLRTFIAERRLFKPLLEFTLPLWCTRNGGERNTLSSWPALGEIVRDRLRRGTA
jgi:hypothetical protein